MQAQKLKLGYCGICDDVQIWKKVGRRVVFTPEYAEISFVLSDGMVYRHGICKRCIVDLTEEQVAGVIERIKVHWNEELVGSATQKQFDDIKALRLETFHMNEKKAVTDYREKKISEKRESVKEKTKRR